MQKITILIHTYNEEKNIEGCLTSAKLLSNNIIVIDMHSNDQTVELAKKSGAIIYSFPYYSYVEPSREYAISKVKTEWFFILDADEKITEKLSEEVLDCIKNEEYTHFKIPRKNIFGGFKWLKHGGWWPDYQIRLINKRHFINWPKEIHSTPAIKGNFDYFKNPLFHLFHGDLKNMVKKTIIFEDIESSMLYKANRKVGTAIFFRKFLGEFYRRMIKHLGFLDGEIGIIESIYQAFSKTITYLYLYEKKNRSSL
ncbi:MAG: glycosyltransferase family 2 protein [Cyanobacteria bacterium]|nr:glycosyltransferase family 2 protein [Cyanobacteriota bacterium]